MFFNKPGAVNDWWCGNNIWKNLSLTYVNCGTEYGSKLSNTNNYCTVTSAITYVYVRILYRAVCLFRLKLDINFSLSRNNQQMSRHSNLFPVNSLHVSDTFRVHHQEINKINCICNLWYGNCNI
jgi:hypothetical protein